MMELGLLLEAKEKLLGIGTAHECMRRQWRQNPLSSLVNLAHWQPFSH